MPPAATVQAPTGAGCSGAAHALVLHQQLLHCLHPPVSLRLHAWHSHERGLARVPLLTKLGTQLSESGSLPDDLLSTVNFCMAPLVCKSGNGSPGDALHARLWRSGQAIACGIPPTSRTDELLIESHCNQFCRTTPQLPVFAMPALLLGASLATGTRQGLPSRRSTRGEHLRLRL